MSGHTEMSKDAWRYTKAPKPGELKGNRYLDPPKTPLDPNLRFSNDGILRIGPLECYDSELNCFEQYEKIDICLKVFTHSGNLISTLNEFGATEFFLPSFALTCAALVWLYDHKDNSDVKIHLDQYRVTGLGLHLQNTIINTDDGTLIHYPNNIAGNRINQKITPKKLPFTARGESRTIESALSDNDTTISLQNLTGLVYPQRLKNIANYFGNDAIVWLPNDNERGIKVTAIGEEAPFDRNKNSVRDTSFDLDTFFQLDVAWMFARGFRLVGGGSK